MAGFLEPRFGDGATLEAGQDDRGWLGHREATALPGRKQGTGHLLA